MRICQGLQKESLIVSPMPFGSHHRIESNDQGSLPRKLQQVRYGKSRNVCECPSAAPPGQFRSCARRKKDRNRRLFLFEFRRGRRRFDSGRIVSGMDFPASGIRRQG